MIDQERKQWNKRQKELRALLEKGNDRDRAIDLFLHQHGCTHASTVYKGDAFSFTDSLLDGLSNDVFRATKPGGGFSIVWRFWHMARIEDITMNILIADRVQVFADSDWAGRIHAGYKDTGNAMDQEQVNQLSSGIDINELLKYRNEVGKATREVVSALNADSFSEPVRRDRLERILKEGAVVPEATGLIDYWGGRTIAGLLLMPPTRHNMVHHNESFGLKPA